MYPKKIGLIKHIFSLGSLIVILLLFTPSVHASDLGAPAGLKQLQEMIQRLLGLAVELGFTLSLLFLVWGGIKFLVSGGESKAVQEASGIVTWALLGVLFLLIAFLILKVIGALTGVDVTQFCLGFPGSTTACGNPN